MNKKCTLIILIVCILGLGACLSGWRGDEGTINIRMGGENGGRALTNGQKEPLNDQLRNCFFDIYLTNGPGPDQSTGRLNYGDTASFSVAPGRWKITVKAFTKDDKENLAAEGIKEADIKPGLNDDITIPMRQPQTGPQTPPTPPQETNNPLEVTKNGDSGEGTLRQAIETALGSSQESKTIVIKTRGPIELTSALPAIERKSITIGTENSVTIKRDKGFTDSLFTINHGGTLTLSGKDSAQITINGGGPSTTDSNINYIIDYIINKDFSNIPSNVNINSILNTVSSVVTANAPLITVNGGGFIMNKGVTLQNNFNKQYGGGVLVNNGGTFTMNGGTISGNIAGQYGGGVYVVSGSSAFTMNGGEISGNIVYNGNGGGVAVGSYGRFFITNGVISGEDSSNANKTLNANGSSGQHGQALYVFNGRDGTKDTSGSAHYGAGEDDGWTDDGLAPNNYNNDTINVENGKLTGR